MQRKVFVKSAVSISGQGDDIQYGNYIGPVEARRMSPLMKRAVVTSDEALKRAEITCPDAIVTGTGYGCIANSDAFLYSLIGLNDEPLRPTHFMQSTHNTVSSMIAIRLKCHGYNATYSHRSLSFESALLDAFIQISSGKADNVLVGAFEELTPGFATLLGKKGLEPYASDGTLSETAVSLVLSSNPVNAICVIDEIELGRRMSPITVDTGEVIVRREEYESKYGGNFCVSALGFADAISALGDKERPTIVFTNICPEQGFSIIKISALCGN